MTILDRLLSALGLGGGSEDRETAEPTVTIEHEPDADDEAAVKGVDVGAADEADADEPTEPTADETIIEPDEGDADETTAEPEGADPDEADEPDEAKPDESDEPEGTEPDGTAGGESVETLKGIGPAYAGRLADVGIGTVADLADADAGEVAERTSLSETRVGRWIDRARERRDA